MKKFLVGIGIFFAATTFAGAEKLKLQKTKIEKRIAQLQSELEKINQKLAEMPAQNSTTAEKISVEKKEIAKNEKQEMLKFAENFVANLAELPEISSLEKKARKQELRELRNAAKTAAELQKAAKFENWILSPEFEKISWEEFLNLSAEQKRFIKIEFSRKNPKKLSPKASRFDQINFFRYKISENTN